MTTSALGSGNPCVAKAAIEYALLGALIAPCGSYGHHCGVSVAERAGRNGRDNLRAASLRSMES